MIPRSLLLCTAFFFIACGAKDINAQNADQSSTTETTADSEAVANTSVEEDPLILDLPESKNELFELAWNDLMPPGELERLQAMQIQQLQTLYSLGPVAEGSASDIGIQIGTFNTVEELDGQKVRIPGYTVPFEFGRNARISEFLLVPTFGACLHNPPPPPNNTVYVVTSEPIKLQELDQAVWVEGYLRTQTAYNDLGNAAYTLEMTKVEAYSY